MTALNYIFCVRNSTLGGTPVLGLSPSFSLFVNLGTLASVTPPTVHELAAGQYYFAWDVDANGEITYQIDCGSTLTVAFDRYRDGECTQADPLRAADMTAIAAAILNALLSSYTTTGTAGAALNKLLTLALDGNGDVTPTSGWTTALLASILSELPTLSAITGAIIPSGHGIVTDSSGDITPTNAWTTTLLASILSELPSLSAITAAIIPSGHGIATDSSGDVSLSPATETAIANALLDLTNAIENGLSMRQTMRVMAAVLVGVAAGMNGNNPTFAAAGNPGTPRVAAITDSFADRTSVTLTP